MRTEVSLQAILDCVALPVWVVDHDGIVRAGQPAAVAALGYDDRSELQGRHGHDTVHYLHRDGSPFPAEDCPVLEPARTGDPVHSAEDWFIRRDGSFFPVSYTSVPIDLPTGRGVVVTFIDLTVQREAEQALRERDAILARVAQPVWVVDHEGRFHYANPAALAALGYDDPAELVGRPGHETVHYKYPDGRPYPTEDCPLTQARESGKPLQDQRGLARAQGRLDRADRVLGRAVRPPGGPRLGHRVHRHRGARWRPRTPRATATSPRRARRSSAPPAGASSRPPTPRAPASRATCTTARSSSSSAPSSRSSSRRSRPARTPTSPRSSGRPRSSRRGPASRELRDLAAGIHPGILTDRGLGPAVDALASRLPLPVTVVDALDRRLPAPVEASLYFFVTEALTNVVKHAGATAAQVRIGAENGCLAVDVIDDGAGGAAATAGGHRARRPLRPHRGARRRADRDERAGAGDRAPRRAPAGSVTSAERLVRFQGR